ncbi:MAG: hypothetical protein KGL01_04015, partial [Betaproteobacteria bacterium]|nr:hypothetical protein [Betaproteobacteria bacterium]
ANAKPKTMSDLINKFFIKNPFGFSVAVLWHQTHNPYSPLSSLCNQQIGCVAPTHEEQATPPPSNSQMRQSFMKNCYVLLAK